MKKHLLFTLLIPPLFLIGCSNDKPKIPAQETSYEKEVQLITIKPGLEQSFNATGDVLPYQSTQITSELRGKTESVNIKEGQMVKENELLIRISSSDISSAYRTAQNNLKNAQLQVESTQLSNDETIRVAQASLETAETNYQNTIEQNKTKRKQAEENLKATETSLKLKISAAETELNNAINTVKPAVQTAFNPANKIIGATESYKYFDEDFRRLLGVGKVGSRQAAENALIKVDNALKSEAELNYETALDLLKDTNDALDKTLTALNNSPTAEDYTQSQLISDINAVTPQITAIKQSINNLKSKKAALETAKQENSTGSQTLIQAKATYENTISQIEANEASAIKAIETAEINLENAKKSAQLSQVGAKSNLSNVYGQFDQASVNQQKLIIRAPFSGKVREINVKNGEEITPGKPLITIENDSQLKIIAYLSPDDSQQVAVGDRVTIEPSGETAVINSISSSADPITKKYKIEILHKSEAIKSGQLVNLVFESNNESSHSNQIFIPLSTLHLLSEEIFVWTIEEGRTKKRMIKVGDIIGDYAEVISGLEPGDQIIDESGRLIEKEGVEVTPVN